MASKPDAAYRVRALLFDMDGTLVDSTVVVERTWTRFARRHGLDRNEVLAACHGRRTAETVAQFASPGMDVEAETRWITDEEVADVDGVVAIAGAVALLATLPAGRWAVVTSADRRLAERRMTAAGLPIPEILIGAEDVASGKPAPDGYLAAARALRVSPAECVVFEDAPAGLQAAHACGATVLAVATTLRPEQLDGERWIPDFDGLAVTPQPDGTLHVTVAAAGRHNT